MFKRCLRLDIPATGFRGLGFVMLGEGLRFYTNVRVSVLACVCCCERAVVVAVVLPSEAHKPSTRQIPCLNSLNPCTLSRTSNS